MRQILTMIVLWFGSFWLRKKVLLCDLISRIRFKFFLFFVTDKQVNISVFAYQGRSNSQDYVTKLFIYFRRINSPNVFWYHYPTSDNVEVVTIT